MNRFSLSVRCTLAFGVLLFCLFTQPIWGDGETELGLDAKTALGQFNQMIGEWRGTGQVRRGSAKGAWRETGSFVWEFNDGVPAIRYAVEDGQLVATAKVTWDQKSQVYVLELKTPDDETRTYTGQQEGNQIQFTSDDQIEGARHRVTFTALNEKRTLVLHEKTSVGGTLFNRVAEVGYTRSGTRLAIPGGGTRECVVTGGTADIPVTYKGKTYYVCCTGCKQAFEDDPEGILADFAARLEKRKAELSGS